MINHKSVLKFKVVKKSGQRAHQIGLPIVSLPQSVRNIWIESNQSGKYTLTYRNNQLSINLGNMKKSKLHRPLKPVNKRTIATN